MSGQTSLRLLNFVVDQSSLRIAAFSQNLSRVKAIYEISSGRFRGWLKKERCNLSLR
jgi:hypothetical protein